jgi:hypothetical protein
LIANNLIGGKKSKPTRYVSLLIPAPIWVSKDNLRAF